jgi:multidrug efflux pump subunit AcrA (membrane-fusion protein)
MSDDHLKKRRRARRPGEDTEHGNGSNRNVYAFDDYAKKPARAQGRRVPPEQKNIVRRKRKANQMRLISAFVFVLFLIYLCFYIGSTMGKEKLSETKIITGSIETPQAYTGIIVRDEKIYQSAVAGVSVFNVADGDRVKKGTVVCGIQDAETVAKLESDLSTIEENIIDLQENRMDYSIYQSDIDDLNLQIKKIVDNEAYLSAISEAGQTYVLKEQVTQKLAMRNKMLLGENRGSLVNLVNDRENTEMLLNQSISSITAEESGIVSYNVDGLETALTMDNLYTLTKEQTTGKPEASVDEADDEVLAENDPAFKIVKSNNWYIAAYLPMLETVSWSPGDYKTLYIQNEDGDFKPFEVKIDTVTPTADEKEVSVVFKCNTMLIEFLGNRSVVFKTESGVEEGYKIPNTAIADKTMLKIPKKYVFTIDSGKISGKSENVVKKTDTANIPVQISITSADDNFVYVLQDISLLKFGDTIVNNLDTSDAYQITEIKNVKGVYVTNTGVMVFKEINMEGRSSANGTYTVIDPALNSSIKNQDNIISDVKTLDGSQKIY